MPAEKIETIFEFLGDLNESFDLSEEPCSVVDIFTFPFENFFFAAYVMAFRRS